MAASGNVLPFAPADPEECRAPEVWLPTVLAWCRRLGGPRIDAEDAAQDAMITILKRHDSLRDRRAERAFVFGITRRTLAAHRRTAWVRRWVGPPAYESACARAHPDVAEDARRQAILVERTLQALTSDQREVIVLVDIEERTMQETAELLDVPTGTVKSRLHRAREAFAKASVETGLAAVRELP